MYNKRLSRTYFTGSQAQIYLNESLLDEIINIEGILEVPQYPIYGYASQHFDTVATGKVIAMGSFTINYVFDGYLYAHILDQKKKYNTEKTTEKDIATPINSVSFSDSVDTIDNLLFNISSETIVDLKKQFWPNTIKNTKEVRPEFIGPLKIKIRDFKIGFPNIDGNLEKYREQYEEKVFIDVFINKYSTMRQASAAQTVETYQFIAKTLV